MPVNINGTTGIDTPGLASSGMPTSGGDPVVESGSNSDGEWVRWADGTQQCTYVGSVPLATLSYAKPYPLSFISKPYVNGSSQRVTSDMRDVTVMTPSIGHNSSGGASTTQWDMVAKRVSSDTTNSITDANLDMSLIATGRWK